VRAAITPIQAAWHRPVETNCAEFSGPAPELVLGGCPLLNTTIDSGHDNPLSCERELAVVSVPSLDPLQPIIENGLAPHSES